MADIVERQKLKADAGLTHLPTELTYELRMAVTGHRADEFLSWGYQWTDKPHRLVYEACGVVEAQAVEIESLYAEVERLESDLADALTDLNTARQDNASFGPELKRLKSELLQRDMTWLPAKDAEIARLKVEVERLKKNIDGWKKIPAQVAAQYEPDVAEIERLKAEVAWYVADKDRWQDAQAAHLRAIASLKAEVERKDAALEKAESHFYNMANAINDEDYRGSVPGIDGVVVGHREEYHKGHVEWLVKYAEEARAALTPSQEPRT